MSRKRNSGRKRLRWSCPQPNPSGLPLAVVYVDGCVVRDQLDVDFTMGGNPARYGFVPEREIWIDACLDGKDRACTIVHELVELRWMWGRGLPYEQAHELANRAERTMRQEVLTSCSRGAAERVAAAWLTRLESA